MTFFFTVKWFHFFYLVWIILFTINHTLSHSLMFLSIAKCCSAIMIPITTITIQIQAVRTSLFLSTFNSWQYEESNKNHKSLCKKYYTETPHTHTHARCVLWCLRSQPISADRDPNWSALIRSEKTQPLASTVQPQILVF